MNLYLTRVALKESYDDIVRSVRFPLRDARTVLRFGRTLRAMQEHPEFAPIFASSNPLTTNYPQAIQLATLIDDSLPLTTQSDPDILLYALSFIQKITPKEIQHLTQVLSRPTSSDALLSALTGLSISGRLDPISALHLECFYITHLTNSDASLPYLMERGAFSIDGPFVKKLKSIIDQSASPSQIQSALNILAHSPTLSPADYTMLLDNLAKLKEPGPVPASLWARVELTKDIVVKLTSKYSQEIGMEQIFSKSSRPGLKNNIPLYTELMSTSVSGRLGFLPYCLQFHPSNTNDQAVLAGWILATIKLAKTESLPHAQGILSRNVGQVNIRALSNALSGLTTPPKAIYAALLSSPNKEMRELGARLMGQKSPKP